MLNLHSTIDDDNVTFPVLSAWLVHVYVQIHKAWRDDSMAIVIHILEFPVKAHGCLLYCSNLVSLVHSRRKLQHLGNHAILNQNCRQGMQSDGGLLVAMHPNCVVQDRKT